MPHHDNIPIWEVEISVIGPITVTENININARKELEHPEPFYSRIKIKNTENGFKATVTAFAPNPELAEKAAILFFGRMLDVLSIKLNLSLQLDVTKNILIQKINQTTKRIVDENDFKDAFEDSRLFSLKETTISRALSWFRKGKHTQDAYDKYLAFWNSIETITSKYNPNKEACKGKGSVCHMWECFKKLWGECGEWKVITGQTKWIDEGNKIRKDIAHGVIPIEIEHIEKVVARLPEMESVAYHFIYDWIHNELDVEITDELLQRMK
ncbi:methylamine utilization protein MauJ [Cellulophaga sp. E6(2014)]|uniref:methylamine utilization protein MauJ n=1 Tax=Cellulophaga sp. E6(2014) TaxID=1495334 RepID=UPI00051D9A2F|nr:methylamine utilization protein MauJ [Cellulophaga sp. E6(2014)]KGK29575.1 hypothetical protein EL45_13330 [Cellulophaga sp. E6(2014)]